VTSPADTPDAPESQSRIGKDDWVATVEGRRDPGSGAGGAVRLQLDRIPHPTYFVLFTIGAFLVPAFTSNGYILRVGFDTLIYMLLALGLNVVVGFAGLLDLGYAAFFGFGAYGYAMLASSQFGLHWATWVILPLVVLATVALGFIVALPSRRLVGDYLAIVTLFFGEIFVTVTNNGESISFLGLTKDYNVTNGPNGIANIDPFHLFGHQLETLQSYYYVALVFFLVVFGAIHLVNRSRTGRAWRSIREDPLAAELMGTPVNRLKLYAFAFGAGVAGLTGTLFASLNTAVFSSDFDTPVLITVYAILILGGAGSLGGVILGALIVNVTLEVLRTPNHATWVFFILILATLFAKLRPWRVLAAVLASTVALGFVVYGLAEAINPAWVSGTGAVTGTLGQWLDHWIPVPANPMTIGNYAFIALTGSVLVLTVVRPFWRNVMLPFVLYLAAFTWDVRLAFEPSITRLIMIGVILIVLMNARPQGLLGQARVEIV
jgi:branched-chain amino acid transport system permease protein